MLGKLDITVLGVKFESPSIFLCVLKVGISAAGFVLKETLKCCFRGGQSAVGVVILTVHCKS